MTPNKHEQVPFLPKNGCQQVANFINFFTEVDVFMIILYYNRGFSTFKNQYCTSKL